MQIAKCNLATFMQVELKDGGELPVMNVRRKCHQL
jgi:hypothetical protein